MTESMILGVGVGVFVLALLGVILTIREFRVSIYPTAEKTREYHSQTEQLRT